jgi:hypothetical protein
MIKNISEAVLSSIRMGLIRQKKAKFQEGIFLLLSVGTIVGAKGIPFSSSYFQGIGCTVSRAPLKNRAGILFYRGQAIT